MRYSPRADGKDALFRAFSVNTISQFEPITHGKSSRTTRNGYFNRFIGWQHENAARGEQLLRSLCTAKNLQKYRDSRRYE